MKYTNRMKVEGELAVRMMSDKAREFYHGADPLMVYEYQTDDGARVVIFEDPDGSVAERYANAHDAWAWTIEAE